MRSPCVSFLTRTPVIARYELVAEAAHCARSTVAEAFEALENTGVLSWVHRIKRVREACPDLLGDNGGAGKCEDV
jgi:AraC-like DNA-binding protein